VPVYLDHAATTVVYDHVVEAMALQQRRVGNPSSLHSAGRAARRIVEESRERLAATLGARPSEVIFTSGGTEADNLAIAGIFRSRRDEDPRRTRIVASAVEHHAVLDCVEALAARDGATVTWVPSDADGQIRATAVREAIELDPAAVALVTVMWANNEVGTVNDVPAIAEVAHAFGIPFHVDAVQAVGHLPVDMAASGADALSLSGHKVGGPGGTGALVLRRDRPEDRVAQYRAILDDEIANLTLALPWIEADPRLGFHAECQGWMFSAESVREKLASLRVQKEE